jgi:hypothetical protein
MGPRAWFSSLGLLEDIRSTTYITKIVNFHRQWIEINMGSSDKQMQKRNIDVHAPT